MDDARARSIIKKLNEIERHCMKQPVIKDEEMLWNIAQPVIEDEYEHYRIKVRDEEMLWNRAVFDQYLAGYGYVIMGTTLIMHPRTPESVVTLMTLKYS
jgi:hypothetical protein